MCEIPLVTVAQIGSSIIHNKGVFATKRIEEGTILLDDGHMIIKMNDADFIYPKVFSSTELRHTFDQYENASNCNLLRITDYKLLVVCDIIEGQEITRRYGVSKWIFWLITDIFHANPVGTYGIKEDQQEYIERVHNELMEINNISNELGYTIEFNSTRDSTSSFTNICKSFRIIKNK